MPQSRSSYDDFPYLGFPRRHAHPSVMAANARIFGIDAPPVQEARILELGCGDGANLLSIAMSLPLSRCCGVDFSKKHIERGEEAREAAGIDNIDLIQADFVNAEYPDEEYDYIIAHGIYSWISEEEQKTMLEMTHRLLSPNGVAFISYNCYPGWNFRKLTREMMLYQTRKLDDMQERVDMARKVLPIIGESISPSLRGYAALIADEQKMVEGTKDYYIAHEHLEGNNQPCYFHQFAERSGENGLRYLCEAELAAMHINRYPPALAALQQEQEGTPEARIEAEQLLDYATLRMFRQTLIVAGHHEISLAITPERVEGLYASAFGEVSEEPEFTDQVETYTSAKGIAMTTASPACKAALYVLAKSWPERLSLDEIVSRATELIGVENDAEARKTIGELLLAAYTTDGLELHADEGLFTATVPDRPEASRLARYQAQREPTAFTLRHLNYDVDPLSRFLIPKLDGTRTAEDIIPLIMEAFDSGELDSPTDPPLPGDPAEKEAEILQQLKGTLRRMAEQGLFVRE